MKRILSIDGGGMKGGIPSAVLVVLEDLTASPAADYFDLVAGTSIGGILACLIGAGKPARVCQGFFTEDGPKIFGHKRPWALNGLVAPRYSSKPIESVLSSRMAGLRFSSFKKPFVVSTAYDLENDEDIVFRSWDRWDLMAWKVARMTSAAQTYFPAVPWRDDRCQVDRVLWDGGIAANNPACLAVAGAMELWPGEPLAVLSLGCGISKNGGRGRSYINAGLLRSGAKTLSTLFDTNDEMPHQILKGILPRYCRIQTPAAGLAMDDASPDGLRRLEEAAHRCVEDNLDRLKAFIAMARE